MFHETVTLRKKRRSCQKWSSRDLACSFSLPLLYIRFLRLVCITSQKQRCVKVGRSSNHNDRAVFTNNRWLLGKTTSRVVYKTTLSYKIDQTKLNQALKLWRSICKVNWRRRFWRVLALEEFTDVQCVIVDHPMPSLAGYRISEGSSLFNSASDSWFLSITLGLARYLLKSIAGDCRF